MVEERSAEAYAEQMAEVVKVDAIIEGLSEDIRRCRATTLGYRQASEIRNSLFMWLDMRGRMLAYAATVEPVAQGEEKQS